MRGRGSRGFSLPAAPIAQRSSTHGLGTITPGYEQNLNRYYKPKKLGQPLVT